MIIINIDFKKIDQSRLKKTATGSYGDLVLIDSPRERNGKRIDGFVKQGVSKEEREQRVEMPILGDWWTVGGAPSKATGEARRNPPPPAKRPPADPDLDAPEDSPIPF
jgi:hypothetical protein